MANSCAIIPSVRNKKGQIVESRLFKDLLSYTSNRSQAVYLYLVTKSQDFINEVVPKLTLDSNNEPTLKSLLRYRQFKEIIPDKELLDKLNKDINHVNRSNKTLPVHDYSINKYRELKQRAIDFNNNSEFKDDYVATVSRIYDSQSSKEKIQIRVEQRTKEKSNTANNMEYNESLNNKLISILESHGVTVGALTDLEERLGINGVTDFEQAKNAANGLIELIRLAKGVRGQKALPEEFSHFAIEALGSNPLVTRLINNIASNNLAKEILGEEYDKYSIRYNGNESKLAKEAAGKLLAKHLLQQESIPVKPYRNLLQRLIQAVKDFFKKFNISSIQDAMLDANKDTGYLAKQILNGSLDDQINVKNINTKEQYYNLADRVDRDKQLLQKIINNELKRLHIYEKRNPNSQFDDRQKAFINELEANLYHNQEFEGIYSFIENTLEELSKVRDRLLTLQSTPSANINEKARVLREVRNYLYSYKHILKDVRSNLLDEESFDDNRYGQRVRIALDNISPLLDDLFDRYNKISMPLFIDFIKPFVGESITVPFGKYKGKVMTAEDLVKIAEQDISFFDRWLDSMADSSDYMLKIMDQAVKKSKENARLDTIEIQKRLQAAGIKLEQAGVTNTDWMFERDDNGNLTGKYISEIDYTLFKKKKKEMLLGLIEKYGNNPVGEDAIKFNRERREWFSANLDYIDGKPVPKKSIYGSKAYQNMNSAQKEFYDTVMEIKAQLDSYLPEDYTSLTNAVKIRKDLVERVKSSNDVKSGAKQIWESIKDSFLRRSDDTEFGDKATVIDFEGNEVQVLPIYYTKLREGESNNDLSTDVVSTLTAYAAMANDFKEMNRVIHVLELGRDMLKERQIVQNRGGHPLVEKFEAYGRQLESTLTKQGDKTRFMQRLDDYFSMQVYGRYMADEGTLFGTRIDQGKAANVINKLTTLNTLAFNILSGISNVATGKVMMRIESFCGEFFTESNTLHADKIYAQYLPEFLSEIGSRVKTNKLALWDEMFNVLQEYEQDVKELNFDRKTWFSKMFGSKALFFMNNAGEHWMQNRTSLALADAYKMKAPDGKIVNLWDSMEVVYINPNNKKLGARLQLKDGYTKADGTAFTKDDIIAFSRKSAAINQRMHGIYNTIDKNAVQRISIGRMGMLFRKWIKPSLNRRFGSATYNYDMQSWVEGYYRTSWRFINQLIHELKEGQINLIANFNNLMDTEKANIIRAITEVAHFLAVAVSLMLLGDRDKDEDNWGLNMLEYQLRRLYTELGAMIPGQPMVSEGLKIVKSPAAGVNTIEDILNLIGILNPFNYEYFGGEDAILQSGRYKGHTRAYKLFFESPVIPMNRTIYKGLHPEESIPFYKQ